jgi:predicted aspartyl protease
MGSPVAAEAGRDTAVAAVDLSTGRPVIELRIDGAGPFRFAFDTGSGADLILDEGLAKELGLAPTGTTRIGDPNSPDAIEAQVVKVDRVEFGGLTLRGVETISWKRHAMAGADAPRGVVGLGLFGPRLVTLDYPRAKLMVEPGELPEPDGRTVFAASFGDGIPSIPIDVAGVSFRAHVDSGSSGFLGLPLGAADRLPLEAPPVMVGRARTASGDYSVSESRLRGTVRVGSIVIENPKVRFVDLPIGNLGSDLLRALAVTVDRKNARVRLVSSGMPLEPTERPRLGVLIPGPKNGRLPIERVVPGSPADLAGLRAGDEIVSLNGRSVAAMSAAERGMTMQARPLAIAFLRDGKPLEATIGAKEAAPPAASPEGSYQPNPRRSP